MRLRALVARATPYLVMLATTPAAWAPRDAWASWVESLVMPGELAAKHARLEQDCGKCHESFDKTAQERLCLSCHTDVDADLSVKRGFHGQEPSVPGRPCKTCHSEHKGRQANIVPLNRETFNHGLTDMPLRGGHTKVQCDNCHVPGKRFREAPSYCSDCHSPKDPHEGSLGIACENCHAETGWKTVRFNHNAAMFPLEGLHREAHCEDCHKTKRFKPTASTCYACHERDDKHHGSFGIKCQSCHTPTRKWPGAEFDHAHKTQFPLLGRHASTSCGKCHKDGLAAERTATTCHGCHERDDAHHGQFGHACETCHTPTDWKRPTFEHDRDTRFALRGRHKESKCTDCHRGNPREEHLDKSCNACHRNDDVHHGRQGPRCNSCHDEHGWSRAVLVDHNATHFPLTGAHVRVACLRCHLSPVFKDVASECVSCHERDALHRCERGTECARCHETSTFRNAHPPR